MGSNGIDRATNFPISYFLTSVRKQAQMTVEAAVTTVDYSDIRGTAPHRFEGGVLLAGCCLRCRASSTLVRMEINSLLAGRISQLRRNFVRLLELRTGLLLLSFLMEGQCEIKMRFRIEWLEAHSLDKLRLRHADVA